MSSIILSTQDILNHRAVRRAAGCKGCKDGSDAPLTSLRGISWRPIDAMNPTCFCIDCRDEYDPDGSIDLQLYQEGNELARWTYATLHEKEPDQTSPLFVQIMPQTFVDFSEVPESLPAPVHRDIANETPKERLTKDLLLLKSSLIANLSVTTDSRRFVDNMDPEEVYNYLRKIEDEERSLWEKIRAIDTILHED